MHCGKRWCCVCPWPSVFCSATAGLLFSLVPACCNIAGLDTPHKRFFKRLIIGGCLFAGCSLRCSCLPAIPLPFILSGPAFARRYRGDRSLHARLLPASLIAAIFT
ncbi:hypothetical protein BANRA_00002 [Klebsiella pneumoniae]|nr:hypothetical protein BANRA_00002 [Klebsiella pneumoniae]